MRTNDMERLIYFPVLSILTMVVFFAAECQAEAMTFGPTPYLSEADSPFDLSGLGTTFFLEDFEDGELNTPGVSPIGAVVRIPSSSTDSVDGDDGQIDGDGTLGNSLESTFGLCSAADDGTSSCWLSLGLNLDPVFDGQLPNAVGFVLTDNVFLADITLTAYDPQGDVIAIITESGLGDGLDNGGTDEDRFFGLTDTSGISTIWIRSGSTFEIDHLQYGIAVPCDFDSNGLCDSLDINALINDAVIGGIKTDLTGDGIVDNADRDEWLALAGIENGFTRPLLVGDSNLDGTVDSRDLNEVAVNWQRQDVFNWTDGNFSVDANPGVDSSDLNALAANWRASAPTAGQAVPEPHASNLYFLAFASGWLLLGRRNNLV